MRSRVYGGGSSRRGGWSRRLRDGGRTRRRGSVLARDRSDHALRSRLAHQALRRDGGVAGGRRWRARARRAARRDRAGVGRTGARVHHAPSSSRSYLGDAFGRRLSDLARPRRRGVHLPRAARRGRRRARHLLRSRVHRAGRDPRARGEVVARLRRREVGASHRRRDGRISAAGRPTRGDSRDRMGRMARPRSRTGARREGARHGGRRRTRRTLRERARRRVGRPDVSRVAFRSTERARRRARARGDDGTRRRSDSAPGLGLGAQDQRREFVRSAHGARDLRSYGIHRHQSVGRSDARLRHRPALHQRGVLRTTRSACVAAQAAIHDAVIEEVGACASSA